MVDGSARKGDEDADRALETTTNPDRPTTTQKGRFAGYSLLEMGQPVLRHSFGLL